jgi:hypothetical protein
MGHLVDYLWRRKLAGKSRATAFLAADSQSGLMHIKNLTHDSQAQAGTAGLS